MSTAPWLEYPCGCIGLNLLMHYCKQHSVGNPPGELRRSPRPPARLSGRSPEGEASQQLTCDLAALGGIVREACLPCRITIPVDICRLNPNRIVSWRYRMHHKRQQREAAHLAWRVAGAPRATGPVRVSLVRYGSKRVDQANLWAAAGACLNGVFKGALTPDDSEEFVRLGDVRQEVDRAHRPPWVVFEVVEEQAP